MLNTWNYYNVVCELYFNTKKKKKKKGAFNSLDLSTTN